MREALKAECSRAENVESARDSVLRDLDEARADAATAAAGVKQATSALAISNEELAGAKMQLEVAVRKILFYALDIPITIRWTAPPLHITHNISIT